MRWYISARARLGVALVSASLSSAGLLLVSMWRTHSTNFFYLLWNLFLAWVPFVLTLWLLRVLRHKLWSSWSALLITLLWLGFLPNAFYLVSDLTHLVEVPRANLVYDTVLFASFVFNGVVLGCLSTFLVHTELTKRISRTLSGVLVTIVLLLCSFAIYLGHDLRWNTWDVLLNPGGLLVDVSEPILHPGGSSMVFGTTFAFFLLLASVYGVVWQAARQVRQQT